MPKNLSGQTDGRTCHKTVTVGRVDQRTHIQVKREYFRLWTDGGKDGGMEGWTDVQPENIMPPAPKGRGFQKDPFRIQSSLLSFNLSVMLFIFW